MTQEEARHPPARRSGAPRGLVTQLVAVLLLLGLLTALVVQTRANLEARGIQSGFTFLGDRSGVVLADAPLPVSADASYGTILLVGLLNTLRVALVGIVLATLLGIALGMARLSPNRLLSGSAAALTELIRNVPLLLQLFLAVALLRGLTPLATDPWQPLPGVYVSKGGMALPWPDHPAYVWMGVALLAAPLLAWGLRRLAGRAGWALPPGAGWVLALGLPLAVWLGAGAPLSLEMPTRTRFATTGGLLLSPELLALTLGLTLYTAVFIGEIVRAALLSVPRGQWEAGLATGLTRATVLRRIVLPQAVRVALPPLTSQHLNLIKNSSLATAIGYMDLVAVANSAFEKTGRTLELIGLIMLAYLTVNLLVSTAVSAWERRLPWPAPGRA